MVFLAFRILQSNQERISALVRGDRQLPVGGVGQFDLSSYPCFSSSTALQAYLRAAFIHDEDGEISALAGSTTLHRGDETKGKKTEGLDLQLRVLVGPDHGKECWIQNGAFFKSIYPPGMIMASCVDEKNVQHGLRALKRADATSDENLWINYIQSATDAVAREANADRCPDLGAPDDYALLYGWLEAEGARVDRLEASRANSQTCEAQYKRNEYSDLALGWTALYYRQHTSEHQLLDVVRNAVNSNAARIDFQLPSFAVDNATAMKFEFTYYKPGEWTQAGHSVQCRRALGDK